jgi:hypothetical protein
MTKLLKEVTIKNWGNTHLLISTDYLEKKLTADRFTIKSIYVKLYWHNLNLDQELDNYLCLTVNKKVLLLWLHLKVNIILEKELHYSSVSQIVNHIFYK